MHDKNFLVCLVGLPASGKTVFADKLKMLLEKRLGESTVKIIDPDKIRKSIMVNKFNYKEEPKVRRQNLKAIEKELLNKFIVISDDLNYYSSMRHDMKRIAEKLDINYFIIYIATPLKVCIKWNKIRGEPIPNKIIKKIHKRFDYFNKYYWDLPFAKYDLSQIKDIDREIEDLVYELIKKNKTSEIRVKKGEYVRSFSSIDKQNLDKFTRMYVGKLLQNPHYDDLKKDIIKLRKVFVRINKNKVLSEAEIYENFRSYLERNLKIKII